MKWPVWLYRLVPYLGRRAAEQDVDEELRLHLELERNRQRDAGVPEDEALREAGRRLGNAALIRERTRDVWGWRWLDDLGRDLRHAVRSLGRSPGFAATVVLALALGIGANTAMFSIVYGMLIRPLPYPDAGAIVRITEAMGPRMSPFVTSASMAALLDEAESFEQLAGYGPSSFSWRGPEGAVTLRAARVSPSMFPLLRATPHLGRLFVEEEARAGADGVVLLSHGAWTRRFGSDPDIVGSAIELNNAPHTVVGVLAEGFFFPSPEEEIWTPYLMPGYSITPPEEGWGDSLRGASFSVSFVTALGRLRPGVSTEQATTEVRTIRQRSGLLAQAAAMGARVNAAAPEVDARVVSLQEELVRGYRPALLALTAATALVLLIACTNVAGLLLARGVTRRRSLAVRAALGAGRGRLARQLLTESVVLSTGGGLIGLAAATVVLRALPAVVPGDVARLDDVGINGAGLAFALALSVIVGLAFGAAPAFQWSRFSLVRALNEGSAQAAGGFRLLRSNRARAALAAAQVALVVLLVGAGLLLRSFVGLVTLDRGYDPTGVITARAGNPDATRGTPAPVPGGEGDAVDARFQAAMLEAMTRLEHLPDVAAVGISSGLPLASGGRTISTRVRVAGRPEPAAPGDRLMARIAWASPGYFDAMRLRLVEGRLFTRSDRAGGPGVVVVNETFARGLSRDGQAVGQRVQLGLGALTGFHLRPSRRIRYTLTARKIEFIGLSSSGDATAPTLRAERFEVCLGSSGDLSMDGIEADSVDVRLGSSGSLSVDGIQAGAVDVRVGSSGDLSVDELRAGSLAVRISSSGDVRIGKGEVDGLDVTINSSGDYRGESLRSRRATVALSSSGNARLWAEESLDARLSSSGSVSYRGDPEVNGRASSSGRIRPIR